MEFDPKWQPNRDLILSAFEGKRNVRLNTGELMERTSRGAYAVRRSAMELVEQGKLVTETELRPGRGRSHRVWRLADPKPAAAKKAPAKKAVS